MPGRLKMKCARLAISYAKDDYWSDLPETIFGQKFSSTRNQTLFLDPYSVVSTKFFNLLYSISKFALPRYSNVSYKILNVWAGEVGHFCFAVSCIVRFAVSGYSSARPKVSRSLLEWLVSFILFMYKICRLYIAF